MAVEQVGGRSSDGTSLGAKSTDKIGAYGCAVAQASAPAACDAASNTTQIGTTVAQLITALGKTSGFGITA